MTHKFSPEKLEKLLRADRLGHITPEEFLREAGLKTGMTFMDIGCGPGFFTIPGAKVVGDSGSVFALDTQEEMLNELRKRTDSGIIKIIKNEESVFPIESSSIDFALLVFVLHEVADTEKFLMEVRRVLKDGGVFVLVDWEELEEESGPPMAERVSRERARQYLTHAGFAVRDEKALNPSNYRIIAIK